MNFSPVIRLKYCTNCFSPNTSSKAYCHDRNVPETCTFMYSLICQKHCGTERIKNIIGKHHSQHSYDSKSRWKLANVQEGQTNHTAYNKQKMFKFESNQKHIYTHLMQLQRGRLQSPAGSGKHPYSVARKLFVVKSLVQFYIGLHCEQNMSSHILMRSTCYHMHHF